MKKSAGSSSLQAAAAATQSKEGPSAVTKKPSSSDAGAKLRQAALERIEGSKSSLGATGDKTSPDQKTDVTKTASSLAEEAKKPVTVEAPEPKKEVASKAPASSIDKTKLVATKEENKAVEPTAPPRSSLDRAARPSVMAPSSEGTAFMVYEKALFRA